MSKQKLRIGFSCGDINGIGIELFLRTFSNKALYEYCTPILYCTPNIVAYYKKVLRLDKLNYISIDNHIKVKEKTINIFRPWKDEVKIEMGNHNADNDKFAIASLEKAIQDYKDFNIEALITLPINKLAFQKTEEKFPGHTEMLQHRFEEQNNLMMMVTDVLKLALVSNHLAVKEVAENITKEAIIAKAKIFNDALKRDFGIDKPKIAVLGLNPHNGDEGVIGKEEKEIILPALEELKANGILALGPYPADGFFGSGSYLKFDGVLAMYHDQGLTPYKMISSSSNGGVNFSAGMKKVRTSPDHGTAYDLVGKSVAKTDSLLQSIFLAKDVVLHRIEYDAMRENPLKKANLSVDKKNNFK